MALLARKTQLAAKAEGTKGTAESLAAADADVLAEDVNFDRSPEELVRNPLRATLSPYVSIPGPQLATITCRCEMKGSGTVDTAPAWGKLLTGCGFKETVNASTSVVYQVNSNDADTDTLTMGAYNDGHRRLMYGARGTVTFDLTANQLMYANFTFTGIFSDDSDTALLSPTYESTVPVKFYNASAAFSGGWTWSAFAFSAMNVDVGNEVVLRPNANATNGLEYAQIVNRNPTGTMDVDKVLVATEDLNSHLETPTTAALSVTLGSAAGNTLTFTAPAFQILSLPDANRDGISTYDMGFALRTSSGDDEFVITQT
jgi:hypothetical protein